MCEKDDRTIEKSWARLYRHATRNDISFFAGAGLSIGCKFPKWEELTGRAWDLCKTGFANDTGESRSDLVRSLQNCGLSLATQLGMARAEFMDKKQSRKRYASWVEAFRTCLYQDFLADIEDFGISRKNLKSMEKSKSSSREVEGYFRRNNPALFELVKMCSIQVDGFSRIVSVLTTNYDSLFQICDRAINGSPRNLRTIERASKSAHSDKVPLYHLHGYLLPFRNTKPKREAAERLILTESEYTERTDQPHHWAATVLHRSLAESPVVFIGCSMTDELCRRALHRTRAQRVDDAAAESLGRAKRRSRPKHFAVCKFVDSTMTNEAIKRSFNLLDLNPLWIRDFRSNELVKRLIALRRVLAK